MLDPSNRFATFVLGIGTLVLLAAIGVGQRMGDRVLGQATEHSLPPLSSVLPTADPNATSGPYGPDWKRSETLSAAPDPRFPDPRVPPRPLPTPLPRPTAAPVAATPTPNPNIPIWRQVPLPTATPVGSPTDQGPDVPSPAPSGTPTL